jgi:hypothetical protein
MLCSLGQANTVVIVGSGLCGWKCGIGEEADDTWASVGILSRSLIRSYSRSAPSMDGGVLAMHGKNVAGKKAIGQPHTNTSARRDTHPTRAIAAARSSLLLYYLAVSAWNRSPVPKFFSASP